MTKLTTVLASLGIALLATAAHAQVNPEGPLDADGDGFLTQAEFQPIGDMGASFVAYDSDSDGLVSKTEYDEAVRNLADEEQDNDLNDREMARVDELTRMFSNAMADRGNLLALFGRGNVDRTETGSIVTDDAVDATATVADDAN